MRQIWTGRIAQPAAKHGEHAPMAAVCCNACPDVRDHDVLSLGIAAAGAVGVATAGSAKRMLSETKPQD